tara:strand:+ start:70 stop:1035 length:966 start_codon:yes stop_codon:yes gene_type:complete
VKITKAKLRQIVLEEAVKLEEGRIASTIASALLPGSGEYGQGAYASNIRDKEMEQRVYERTVLPYAQTYYDMGREYGISPNLIAGIMMDEDIRMYPDPGQSIQQVADWWADIPGDDAGEEGTFRNMVAGSKRPAVSMASTKLSSIIKDLAQNINPKNGEPWIDLDELIGPSVGGHLSPMQRGNSYFATGRAEEVSEWLKKPENAIRVVAARLAYDKERFKRLADRDLTDQELATGYADNKKTPLDGDPKDGDYTSSARGDLAATMGSEWLKPEVEVPEVKVAENPEEEDLDFPAMAIDGDKVKIPEGIILDMIKGAIRELL